MVRHILGFAIIVAGVIFGTYIGVWVLFVGGVVEVIGQIRTPILEVPILAHGVASIVFSFPVGSILAGLFTFAGLMIIDD